MSRHDENSHVARVAGFFDSIAEGKFDVGSEFYTQLRMGDGSGGCRAASCWLSYEGLTAAQAMVLQGYSAKSLDGYGALNLGPIPSLIKGVAGLDAVELEKKLVDEYGGDVEALKEALSIDGVIDLDAPMVSKRIKNNDEYKALLLHYQGRAKVCLQSLIEKGLATSADDIEWVFTHFKREHISICKDEAQSGAYFGQLVSHGYITTQRQFQNGVSLLTKAQLAKVRFVDADTYEHAIFEAIDRYWYDAIKDIRAKDPRCIHDASNRENLSVYQYSVNHIPSRCSDELMECYKGFLQDMEKENAPGSPEPSFVGAFFHFESGDRHGSRGRRTQSAQLPTPALQQLRKEVRKRRKSLGGIEEAKASGVASPTTQVNGDELDAVTTRRSRT